MIEGKAKLLYAVNPLDGRLLLNVQTAAGDFAQIEMSREQLAGLIVDGVRMLLSDITQVRRS
jgi:hypothetical protein